MRNELTLITAAILQAHGNEPWYFDCTPIIVRLPFSTVFIYGLQVTNKNELQLLTLKDNGFGEGEEEWNVVEAKSVEVVRAIYSRVFKKVAA